MTTTEIEKVTDMSNAVTNLPQSHEVAAPSTTPMQDSAAILQVIERAAQNPNVDVDKMERLLAMHERILERNAKQEYITALADMQPKLPVITERGKVLNKSGGIQSRYALWEDINEALRPILHEHGFALAFKIGTAENGSIAVTGILSHRGGHSEGTTFSLPHDTSGNKNDVQGVGSSISYGKRYAALALLNITSKGEDDDGHAAGVAKISPEQKVELIELLKGPGQDTKKFLAYLKVSTLDDLPASRFQEAKQALLDKAKRVAQ